MSTTSGHSTTTTTYRTMQMSSASPEPTITATGTLSPVTNGNYETVRYLVPMQGGMQQAYYQPVQQQQMSYVQVQPQQQSYVQVQPQQQSYYIVQQQPQMQMVSPVYLQGVQTIPRCSVSSHESDTVFKEQTTVESISGESSIAISLHSTPEPNAEEEEEQTDGEEVEEEEEEEEVDGGVLVEETVITNTISTNTKSSHSTTVHTDAPQPDKMDTKYFGELLAEVYRKNCDIHSTIFDHVTKIRGQKHQLDPSNDYKEKEEVESLLPKGTTELTKQQIRYLLQTRLVADKSMRLLLSTFSSLREELLHMSEDMRRLEMEKESLERDLSFKVDQAQQYELLLEAVRENNKQLQLSLKEAGAAQRALEGQLLTVQGSSSSSDSRIQDLEAQLRAMELERNLLKTEMSSSSKVSSSKMLADTDKLSRQYKDQLEALRREKDAEIQRLMAEMRRIESASSSRSSSDQSLQLKISELLAQLDQRQGTISKQEEELKRLRLQISTSASSSSSNSSRNVSSTTITNSYSNRYPMLRLLSDDFESKISTPVRESRTLVFHKSS